MSLMLAAAATAGLPAVPLRVQGDKDAVDAILAHMNCRGDFVVRRRSEYIHSEGTLTASVCRH